MKTTIDWLTIRFRDNPFTAFDLIKPAFGSCSDLVQLETSVEPKDGWLYAANIVLADSINLGRLDYGGESQRGWTRLILTGVGCEWVQDWNEISTLSIILDEPDIRRLDICLTTKKGEVNHEMVISAFDDGQFITRGKPPVMRCITSSDPTAGKTIYIGKRENDKFARCYEKGFELLKDVKKGKELITHIHGDLVQDIYRVEVEFKGVTKHIPFSSINDRDLIFAGAYPFCATILCLTEGRVLKTLPTFKPLVTLDKALENCRVSYGQILRTALEALDGDKLVLLDRIISSERSDALMKAGVLTIDHPI
jgi:DNA relaxase NicK